MSKPLEDRRFYQAAWRWHFYAGLYVAPFLIMLAVTGLLMLWSAVLVGRDGEKSVAVRPQASSLAVSVQAVAAEGAIPGGKVVQYIAPRTSDQPAVFRVNGDAGAKMVAVDPYTGQALSHWDRRNGVYDLANKIHGTLFLGNVGDWLIEIAAGFGIVLIATGLYMWWPRGEGLRAALVPDFSATGRAFWKSLHKTVGAYSAILLAVFLISGLTWAGVWGEKFTQAWSTFPAEKWDNVPLSDDLHASMNHGGVKEVPWTLEQTPMPASGSSAGTVGTAPGAPVTLDSVIAFARAQGFDGRFQLAFPKGEKGVWTLSRDTMSNDSADPTADRTVHLDQFTGKVLADIRYADYGWAGKAMAIGIAFHEGDMGVWNIALVTVFCLSVILISASGIALWWLRRPKGAGRLLAPRLPENLPLWKTGALVMVGAALLFPLSGAVLVAVLALDLLLISRVKPLKKALS